MSDKEQTKEVVNWEEKLAAEAKDVAKLERPPTSKIGFRSGIMTYMGEAVPKNEMTCIVVTYGIERVFYAGTWDANNIVPPDCYALSTPNIADDMGPDSNVPNPVSEYCHGCPHDEWGSGSGKGKLCGERRRLIVLPESCATKPESIPTAEMAMMSIPVTSLKNWSKYVNMVSAQLHRPYWAVLTKVSLVPDANTQFKVNFENMGALDDSVLGAVQAATEAAALIAMSGYDMTPPAKEESSKKKGAKY